MTSLAYFLVAAPVVLFLYAYVGYPVLLRLVGSLRPHLQPVAFPKEWPTISITVPAYNEEAQIRANLESLLQIDYPPEKRQILVVSDASTDRTDEIVAEYEDRGVELLRLPERTGKDGAEIAAFPYLRGDIIVNTDASIRIHPGSLKPLIACFSDPAVGLASGRDVSIGTAAEQANAGESGYVGYEMWVRRQETRVGGIVGASGCFYAIRRQLHATPLPTGLSRDFASAMLTREQGYRAVSVDEAICSVPRTSSLRREYRRKVRTMTRGMQALLYKRHLMNPFRYGVFAWMLFSHKLCRWLVPWAMLIAFLALGVLSATEVWARWLMAGVGLGLIAAALGWMWQDVQPPPRLLAIPAFGVASNLAVLHAWVRLMRGELNPMWEPTRREVTAVQ